MYLLQIAKQLTISRLYIINIFRMKYIVTQRVLIIKACSIAHSALAETLAISPTIKPIGSVMQQ